MEHRPIFMSDMADLAVQASLAASSLLTPASKRWKIAGNDRKCLLWGISRRSQQAIILQNVVHEKMC
jgi:hypothetical protein